MKNNIGLWIDHRQAVIVQTADDGEEIKVIPSHADRQLGRTEGARSMEAYEALQVPADNRQQRMFSQQLNAFYDEVIAAIHDADSLLILGPGEAKGELAKRLAENKPSNRTLTVRPADKLTTKQIATEVRNFFEKEKRAANP